MKRIDDQNDSEWHEACLRVRSYLRAMRVTSEAQREEIVLHILARAARRQIENPGLRPVVLAMQEIRAATARWLKQIEPSREQVTAVDYLALLAVNTAERWPAAFLAEEVPGDLQQSIRKSNVSAVPELRVSSMVPEPFDPLLAALPLRNALARLAGSLALQISRKTAAVPAKTPPPAHWPQ
jgi:hypothetical protein